MDVNKIHPRCLPILPTVYDESLSYYESVCKLVSKVNELVDFINNIKLDIFEEAKAYTDGEIVALEGRVTQAVKDVQEIEKELSRQYEVFEIETTKRIDGFDDRLSEMSDRINGIVGVVNARTDLAIEQNNEYIFDQIENNILSNISVINYFTGETVSVQDMFNYLATLHLENSLTYAVLVTKAITVDYLIGKSLTYTQLVKNGGTLL